MILWLDVTTAVIGQCSYMEVGVDRLASVDSWLADHRGDPDLGSSIHRPEGHLKSGWMILPGPILRGLHILRLRSLTLLLTGRLYHVTSGLGTPVTLHVRMTISPSWTVTSSLDSSSMIWAGTETHKAMNNLNLTSLYIDVQTYCSILMQQR